MTCNAIATVDGTVVMARQTNMSNGKIHFLQKAIAIDELLNLLMRMFVGFIRSFPFHWLRLFTCLVSHTAIMFASSFSCNHSLLLLYSASLVDYCDDCLRVRVTFVFTVLFG